MDPYVESDAGLRLLLESIGHTVCVACSALTVVSSFAPHVVLVDANLPDADGCELAQVFRELPGLAFSLGWHSYSLAGTARGRQC